jgi:hypothetical protein
MSSKDVTRFEGNEQVASLGKVRLIAVHFFFACLVFGASPLSVQAQHDKSPRSSDRWHNSPLGWLGAEIADAIPNQ